MQDRLRRLDALFAMRVLGHGTLKMPVKNAETEEWSQELFIAGSGFVVLPRYTRSLDAAWEGMERFKSWDFGIVPSEGEWCTWFDDCHGQYGEGKAPHPAEAIVLACLRAVGCTEEELTTL